MIRAKNKILVLGIYLAPFILPAQDQNGWMKKEVKGFEIEYTENDKIYVADFENDLIEGNEVISSFFGMMFKHKASVHIFPDRRSLDKQWQTAWGDSTFRSECWMVASGVADRLDVVSPRIWTLEKCEHNGESKKEIKEILCHELVHCFHAQHNPSPDFGAAEDMDWFIEGLATYVSGQLTSEKKEELKKLNEENKLPNELKKIWKGKYKYAMAGSMVEFILVKFGKRNIVGLLNLIKTKDALDHLQVNEADLIKGWKDYLNKM